MAKERPEWQVHRDLALQRGQEAQAVLLTVAQLELSEEQAAGDDDAKIQEHMDQCSQLARQVQHFCIRTRQNPKEGVKRHFALCALSLATVGLVRALLVQTYEQCKRHVLSCQKVKPEQLPDKGRRLQGLAEASRAWVEVTEAGLAQLNMRDLGRRKEYTLETVPLLEACLEVARAALAWQEAADSVLRAYTLDQATQGAQARIAALAKPRKRRKDARAQEEEE